MDQGPQLNQKSPEENRKEEISKLDAVAFWAEYFQKEIKDGSDFDKNHARKRLDLLENDPIKFLQELVDDEFSIDDFRDQAKETLKQIKIINKKYGIETAEEPEAEPVVPPVALVPEPTPETEIVVPPVVEQEPVVPTSLESLPESTPPPIIEITPEPVWVNPNVTFGGVETTPGSKLVQESDLIVPPVPEMPVEHVDLTQKLEALGATNPTVPEAAAVESQEVKTLKEELRIAVLDLGYYYIRAKDIITKFETTKDQTLREQFLEHMRACGAIAEKHSFAGAGYGDLQAPEKFKEVSEDYNNAEARYRSIMDDLYQLLKKFDEPALEASADIEPLPYQIVDSSVRNPEMLEAVEENLEDMPLERLESVIEQAKARMAEINREIEIEETEELLAKKVKELKGSFFTGGKKKEVAALALKLDRLNNQFKYFVIEKMHPKNFKIVFGTDPRDITLKTINSIVPNMAQAFQEGIYIYPVPKNDKVSEREGVAEFSINGFYLKIKNKKVVTGKGGVNFEDPRARFDLVDPSGEIVAIDFDMDFAEGQRQIALRSREYQTRQVQEFEKENLSGNK